MHLGDITDRLVTKSYRNFLDILKQSQPSNPSNPTDSMSLSNPSNPSNPSSDALPPVENIETNSDGSPLNDSGKKVGKTNKEQFAYVETIQPDISGLPSHGANTRASKRTIKNKATKLVQEPQVVNRVLEEKQNEEENVHALRKEQLLSVNKEEIQKIYEMKNYAYLRPEEMKNLRLVSRPRTPPMNSVTPTESDPNKIDKIP
ncbi:unnamed protein product [Xylocopa violacea]|uniref:Uncharacterized protein n=1 Tax=Xylocopa violacea TaxID=135666 RepID=A0ABP1NWE8_XYLVO